jgi:hypothetical protein
MHTHTHMHTPPHIFMVTSIFVIKLSLKLSLAFCIYNLISPTISMHSIQKEKLVLFSPSKAANGWIQTLELKILSCFLYHCATTAGPKGEDYKDGRLVHFYGATTLNITTFSITTLRVVALNIMTLRIMTLSIIISIMTLSIIINKM